MFEIELLGSALRLPFGFEIIAEPLKILLLFAGEDDPAGAEAVTQGIEANGGLSLGSSGARRETRVSTIGLDLSGCRHMFLNERSQFGSRPHQRKEEFRPAKPISAWGLTAVPRLQDRTEDGRCRLVEAARRVQVVCF
ncbi:MAG TPA: hypothetical protein VE959_06715 [Bryobacteraceae bacterium]|nr:hypothetical protein [Bryobacteraceae bacterium]